MLYPQEPQPARQPLALTAPPAKTKRRHTVVHEEWPEEEDPAGSSTQAEDNITLRGRLQETAQTNPPHPDTTSSTAITTPRSRGGQQKRGREDTKSTIPPTTKRHHTD